MSVFFKKFKTWSEEHSPQSYSLILAIPVAFLILGFFIWNIYLYTFGFLEDELLRAKFISTGFFFFFLSTILWSIIDTILDAIYALVNFLLKFAPRVFPKINCQLFTRLIEKFQRLNGLRGAVYFYLFIPWFIFYVFLIFPFLPSALGGGQPRSISLIAPEATMPILKSLGIKLGQGAIFQTENLCIVHENGQGVFVLRGDRVLMLDKTLFLGFGSLPGIRSEAEQQCIAYAKQWSWQGLKLGLLLLNTQIKNLISGLQGQPQESFHVVM